MSIITHLHPILQFSLVIDSSLLGEEEPKYAESHPDFAQLKYIASTDLIQSALNCKEWREEQNSVVPLCHTWLPSGHVLFGCKHGEILKIDAESHSTEIFHKVPLGENEVLDCAINVILVHKNGVYIATELGQIICLDVTPSAPTAVKGHLAEDKSPTVLATNAKLVSHLYTNQSILSGYFSLYYDKIVFRTKNGAILIYQPATNSYEVYEDSSKGKFSFAQPICPGNDMIAVKELESETHAPEGIDLSVWKKLCDYRRKKLQSEQEKGCIAEAHEGAAPKPEGSLDVKEKKETQKS
ncbi:uncharacterized protein LOC142340385 [Convolutriloba macropyga]|uniref:uncharacterized protein LOC142340385 n=1 Tax=Convolutriloba macropyga TaxID=536237 RepID=UPI003F51C23E